MWGRVQKTPAALKLPVGGRCLEPAGHFLELAGHLKLAVGGGRALVREVTKNPMTTLSEFLSGEREEPSRRSNHLCPNQARVYQKVPEGLSGPKNRIL